MMKLWINENHISGWFSNRTGTSVDDDARKSNSWLDQWLNGKLGSGSRVSSFPRALSSSNDVPIVLLNLPNRTAGGGGGGGWGWGGGERINMKEDHLCYRRTFCWVHNGPIQRPAHSWLVSSIGRALHRYQGFESRTSLNFFRLSFRSCKICVYNCDDLLSY